MHNVRIPNYIWITYYYLNINIYHKQDCGVGKKNETATPEILKKPTPTLGWL